MAIRWIVAAALLLAAPAAAQAQQPTLEQRVQRMEDESAIRRMLIEYGAFLDAKDYHSYAALFAPDGVWQGGFGTFTGPAAIEAMLTANLGAPEAGYVNKTSFHMLTNPLITIDGDRAHVESKYLFWTASPDNRPTPLLAGRYVDEFVRVGGEWRIARRTTWGQIPFRDPNLPPVPGGGPAAAPAAVSSDARLRQVEDQLAIQRVLVEYGARIDARDYTGYAALFAREGTWQNGATVKKGREEIEALLVGLFGTPAAGFVNREDFHMILNPQIDVDGDHAKVRSRHLLVMRGADGSPVPELAGVYEDEFVREDGQWKILHRVDNPIMPTAEEWRKEMAKRQARVSGLNVTGSTRSGAERCVVGKVDYERSAEFGAGSSELSERAAQNLRLLSIQMRSSDTSVYIHSGGGERPDEALSQRRSAAVRDFLLAQGLPPDRLVVSEPATDDLDADGLRILSDVARDCDAPAE